MFHILHILRKKLRNKIKNASLKDIEKMLTKFFELWQEKKSLISKRFERENYKVKLGRRRIKTMQIFLFNRI